MKIRTQRADDRRRDAGQLVLLFVAIFWMFFTMRYPIMGWTLTFGLVFAAWSVLRARIDRRHRIALRSGGAGPGSRRDDPTRVLIGLTLLFTILFAMALAIRHDATAWPLALGVAIAGYWALRYVGRRRRRVAARLAAA